MAMRVARGLPIGWDARDEAPEHNRVRAPRCPVRYCFAAAFFVVMRMTPFAASTAS
jgi:hypothetical protein